MPKNTAVAAKTGLGAGKILAIIVAIVVVVGGGAFILNSQHAPQKSLPVFPDLGTPIPSAFASVSTAPHASVPAILAAISSQSLANQSQFNVSYVGTLDAQGTGARSIIAIDSPIFYNYSSYGPDQRLDISLTSASAFGFVNVQYFNVSSGKYTCTDFNSTAASEGNMEGLLLGSRAVSCITGSELAGFDLSRVAVFDLSLLQNEGVQVDNSTTYESVYHEMPCTYVYGSLSGTNGTGAYGICYSDAYDVPLSLTAYYSGSTGSFFVNLNETSISNSSSQTLVDTLPQ